MLFNIHDIPSHNPTKSEDHKFGVNRFSAEQKLFATNENLAEIIPTLQMGDMVEFFTDGKWSTHHLVEELVRRIGTCKIYFSTWAISEESIRVLFKLKEEGLLSEINALLESKIPGQKDKAFGFAKEFFDEIRLTHCHAKVTILQNDHYSIVVNSSSNWTRNKRLESGVIICSHESAAFHKNWLWTQQTS
ncbi:MAG: hypothetical protein ACOVOV_04565 [Dolichospermum sp.]